MMPMVRAQTVNETAVPSTNTTQDDDGTNSVIFDASDSVIVTNQAMGARCAVSADFDGDGLQDLVSASSNDNAVSWFRNEGNDANGNPVFSIKNKISWASKGSRIVTVGDVGKFALMMCVLSLFDDVFKSNTISFSVCNSKMVMEMLVSSYIYLVHSLNVEVAIILSHV